MGSNSYIPGSVEEARTMPIAIIGISCRFPGAATDPEKLWEMCANSHNAWSEIPEDRFNKKGFYHCKEGVPGTMTVKSGHFLSEDISFFDASFFNFSLEVATSMDPQLRLLLECAFEALENAGVSIEQIAGTLTSVFTATFTKDHHDSLLRDPDNIPRYFTTGNGAAMLSNRISHFFDLRGASMTLDTACSSSLAALHLACQSIRIGESDTSIVAGANLILNPDMFIAMSSLGFLSPDGKCYAFDSRAAGYGRGEGVACLIIKSLESALRDGDPIRAIIRETALGQDGKTPTLTTPSQSAQEELIRLCYIKAGLNPSATDYIEAHGTGTKAGDPVEAAAIANVLGSRRPEGDPIYVGSVKTNIGHLEGVSGLAGIIKVVMSLEKGLIAPNINFEFPNESILPDKWNIKIPRKLEIWKGERLRRASISSFGYGGLNSHAILEQTCDTGSFLATINTSSKRYFHVNGIALPHRYIFTASANDEKAIVRRTSDLIEYLKSKHDKQDVDFLPNLAYTLASRRSNFKWRISVSASNREELIEALLAAKPTRSQALLRLGYVFTGQGSQWYAMGRELLEAYPVFKKSIDKATDILRKFGAAWSLLEELTRDISNTKVGKTHISAPLGVAVQLALVDLLKSWDITPTGVTGHSSGEVAAAYAVGFIDFDSAMAIVYFRGALTSLLQEKAPDVRGGMIAVGLGHEDMKPYCDKLQSGKVVIACINSPSSVTVSGDIRGIEELEGILEEQSVFVRRVKVDAAYHSHHMQPIAQEYSALLKPVLRKGNLSNCIYSSPVTGARIDSSVGVSPEHWTRNMTQPVLFTGALQNLCLAPGATSEPSIDFLIELGPHSALAGPIRQILAQSSLKSLGISYSSCLIRGQNAVETMQDLACILQDRGYKVNSDAINFPFGENGHRVLSDLPKYPWTHDVRHCYESRLIRTFRSRKYPHNELIGSLVSGSSSLELTWRRIIRPSDIPWVRQHTVQSSTVYPAAGYIAMVVEAARQSANLEGHEITGYNLRDIDIKNALVIPMTFDEIEIRLLFRKSTKKTFAGTWKEFLIYTCTKEENVCIEHCSGFVCSQVMPDTCAASWWTSPTKITPFQSLSTECRQRCLVSVEPAALFEFLGAVGICHGPLFQNIVSIKSGQDRSKSVIRIPDTTSVIHDNIEDPYVLHPATLDSIFLSAYQALPLYGFNRKTAMVPSSIEHIFISQNINNNAGHQFETFSALHTHNNDVFEASISVANETDEEQTPVLQVTGLRCVSLGNSIYSHETQQSRLCFKERWDYDVKLSKLDHLKDTMESHQPVSESLLIEDLRCAAFHYMLDATKEISTDCEKGFDEHRKRFYDWIKLQISLAKKNKLGPSSSGWTIMSEEEKKNLLSSVSFSSMNGQMLCRVGPRLGSILRNECSPLQIMLEDQLLHSYYRNAIGVARSYAQINRLVEMVTHKNPRSKILEIGAGTGGCTQNILQVLGGNSNNGVLTPKFLTYDFTDVSSGFFDSARQKLRDWGDMISYKRLDIEEHPSKQSFECNTYDLIIACQVLHATREIEHTMTNVRKLLKPGGKLLLVETTKDLLDVALVFGTLPGWWLGEEEERKYSPSLTIDGWKNVLEKTGFNGIDIHLKDCADEEHHSMSVIMSTAIVNEAPSFHSDIAILHNGAVPESWLEDFKSNLQAVTSNIPEVGHLGSVAVEGKVCIYLGDMIQPGLPSPRLEMFEALKTLLVTSKGVLWISSGGTMDCEIPTASLHLGLLRSLRCEDNIRRYISLDLQAQPNIWTTCSANAILTVFRSSFDYRTGSEDLEFEYAQRGDSIFIPRIEDDVSMSIAANDDRSNHLVPETQSFRQPGRRIRMEIGTPGLLDSLSFRDDPDAEEELSNGMLEIEPKAFGINFRDIMVAMGQLDETVMGYECSGIITRTSGDSEHKFKVGDRVCALMKGHYATQVRVHWTCVGSIPDEMSFEVAASVLMPYTTAYYSLYTTANLQEGETVLIHAGSGGVGQAAIMLAQNVGAEVFTSVGSKEKRDFVADTYGIPHDHIFSSRDPSFGNAVMVMTQGKGVDVILNSLAGPLLRESWNCLAVLGRFVEIGKRDIMLNNDLEMQPFLRNTSFHAIDLTYVCQYRKRVIANVVREVTRLLGEKTIRPIQPISVYPISEIERAFRLIQSGKHIGKVVVKPNGEDIVKVIPRIASASFSPESSYLIVGGLGGIGKSIAEWMVRKGVKYLVLLSRRATYEPEVQKFLNKLTEEGCKVKLLSCDVSNSVELETGLEECELEMPPIRGIIQAAMVLKDVLFERMSYEDYCTVIGPKVQGTLNIHEHLQQLDFFILLSSVVGIAGNASQANYAAGGAFQDAFARYRNSIGLPAVSIDLGVVSSVGYVAQRTDVKDRLTKAGFKTLGERQVINIVNAAIAHSNAESSCSIITAISDQFQRNEPNSVWARDMRFRGFEKIVTSRPTGTTSSTMIGLQSQLIDSKTASEAVNICCGAIVKKIAEIFMIPEDEVDRMAPASKYGVDSLVAVELRNWLGSFTKSETAIFDILQSPSLLVLAEKTVAKSGLVTTDC